MWSTAEHANGYELQLWRDGQSVKGFWFRTRGRASDFPVVSVIDLAWDTRTGAFRFRARWCDEIQAFEGVLTNETLAGTLTTSWSSKPQELLAVILKKSEYSLDRMPRSEWTLFIEHILKTRGPKC